MPRISWWVRLFSFHNDIRVFQGTRLRSLLPYGVHPVIDKHSSGGLGTACHWFFFLLKKFSTVVSTKKKMFKTGLNFQLLRTSTVQKFIVLLITPCLNVWLNYRKRKFIELGKSLHVSCKWTVFTLFSNNKETSWKKVEIIFPASIFSTFLLVSQLANNLPPFQVIDNALLVKEAEIHAQIFTIQELVQLFWNWKPKRLPLYQSTLYFTAKCSPYEWLQKLSSLLLFWVKIIVSSSNVRSFVKVKLESYLLSYAFLRAFGSNT